MKAATIPTVLVLSIFLFAFSSCKKSSTSPSIVGTWKFTNITGTILYNSMPSEFDSTTYSYNSANNTLTTIEYHTAPFIYDTVNYLVSLESWTFSNDGSYSITETYSGNGFTTTTNNITGVWEFLSNTHANSGLLLEGASSNLFPYYSQNVNNSYTIQTLNSSTLVLTNINSEKTTAGQVTNNNIAITFSRQ